jgi:hypothetical protein
MIPAASMMGLHFPISARERTVESTKGFHGGGI